MLLWCQPTKTMLYFGCKVNMSFGLCKAVACGGNFPLIIWCSWTPAVAALWFLHRLNTRIEIGADFKSCLSMQKSVRPQELVYYKIKKVVNLSRFAMPMPAVAVKINPWSRLRLELCFWGAEACTESCALSLDSHPCFSYNIVMCQIENDYGFLESLENIHQWHCFWSLEFMATHTNEIAFWISFFLWYSHLNFEWKIPIIKILAISK